MGASQERAAGGGPGGGCRQPGGPGGRVDETGQLRGPGMQSRAASLLGTLRGWGGFEGRKDGWTQKILFPERLL